MAAMTSFAQKTAAT